jgi:hypothetical protein
MSRVTVSVESVLQTLSATERYFRGGNRWGQGMLHNPVNGNKCLQGAVSSVQAWDGNTSWVPADAIAAARYYIERAVREQGALMIEEFNDCAPSFHEIAAVIARAKEMAAADARPLPAPAPMAQIFSPRPLPALSYQPEERVEIVTMADLERVAVRRR